MLDVIHNNIGNILVTLSVISGTLILYKLGKVNTVRKIILALVIQAEKALGSGTGELKYAVVINSIYDRIPTIVRILFTKKEIDQFIEESVQILKKTLKNGITLTGYDEELYMRSYDK